MAIEEILGTDTISAGFRAKYNGSIGHFVTGARDNGNGTISLFLRNNEVIEFTLSSAYLKNETYSVAQINAIFSAISNRGIWIWDISDSAEGLYDVDVFVYHNGAIYKSNIVDNTVEPGIDLSNTAWTLASGPSGVTGSNLLSGPADPVSGQGTIDNWYLQETDGAWWKRELVVGVSTWVLKYRPVAGGGDTTGLATVVYVDDQDAAINLLISNLKAGSLETIASLRALITDLAANDTTQDSQITQIMNLLSSDKPLLDTVQEIVDYIEQNRSTIDEVLVDKLNTSVYNAFIAQNALDLAGKEPVIEMATENEFWSGAKTWLNFADRVFSRVLPALVAGANTPIVAGISLVAALQNLQAQITALGTGTAPILPYSFAVSDEATALTAGLAKISFRMPYAFTLSNIKASLNEAAAGSIFIVNIKHNGVTIFSTNLTIDAGELTSVTAATPVVISNVNLLDDALITVDIVQVGSTTAGKGLKISFIGTKP